MILSVEAMTAAVQVWDKEKKMLTVAQTIGTNQIPLPAQVLCVNVNLVMLVLRCKNYPSQTSERTLNTFTVN